MQAGEASVYPAWSDTRIRITYEANFSRGPSLQIRLILAVLVALGIIIADSRLGTFSQIRTYMDTAVSPFYFVSNAPRELLDGVSQTLASRDQLELENRALRQELLLKTVNC